MPRDKVREPCQRPDGKLASTSLWVGPCRWGYLVAKVQGVGAVPGCPVAIIFVPAVLDGVTIDRTLTISCESPRAHRNSISCLREGAPRMTTVEILLQLLRSKFAALFRCRARQITRKWLPVSMSMSGILATVHLHRNVVLISPPLLRSKLPTK